MELIVLRLADASVRVVVLAALALLLVALIRRSAAAQHMVWTVILAAMLAMPFARILFGEFPYVLTPTRYGSRMWIWIAAIYFSGVAVFGARLLGGLLLPRRALRDARAIHPASPEYFERITY